MQTGDKYKWVPSAFAGQTSAEEPGRENPKTRQVIGRVIYIHPQRRYFTVEALVNGTAIRESFIFKAH